MTAVTGGLAQLGEGEQARAAATGARLAEVGDAVASAVAQSAAADSERLRSLNEAVAEARSQLGAAMTAAATQGAAFAERVEQTASVLARLEEQQATRLDERAERLFNAMSTEASRFEAAQAARAKAADARVGELDSILAAHLRSLGDARSLARSARWCAPRRPRPRPRQRWWTRRASGWNHAPSPTRCATCASTPSSRSSTPRRGGWAI